ncbi:MAG: lipopolysaccharide assembly protein LapA domain-containing protein [Oculatellaceae cyanobacterium Prado106]|jgi:uncharacterized integral membrane protein|nr:lipopolysaccharide assembly protein LapA domain-containing protein [Oculatellaceae cyanobacterium Prado106]
MNKFLTTLIITVWVLGIALISVQNAAPVSLRFLIFQSVQIPMGLVLAFSATLGMLGMAIALPLLRPSK